MESSSSLGTESPTGTKKRVRDDSPSAVQSLLPVVAPAASNAFAMMGRASKALRGGLMPSGAAPASDSEVSSSLPSSSLLAPLVALPPKTVATRSIGTFFASKSGRPPPPVVQHSAALLSNPTQFALPTESGDDDSVSSLLPLLTDAPLVGVAPLTSFFSKASASTPLAVLPPLPRGICGLSNLGFTCYMSAIVQALIACVPLAAYFRQGHFAADLREHGQFGSGARIAIAFAALLGDMDAAHAARSRYVAPRALRAAVCRRTSAFPSGMQDAQEFLQFMLEHLHEDCSNRAQSVGGGTGAETASLSHLPSSIQGDAVAGKGSGSESQRRSVLSDLFQGHCRQRVRCRSCLSESVKVDPFNSISVPLPANTLLLHAVSPTSTSDPQTVSAPADAQGTVNSASVAAALTDAETPPSVPCELVDCLRLFTAAETLSDGFLCSACKKVFVLGSKYLPLLQCS
jgi:hypothetical protein